MVVLVSWVVGTRPGTPGGSVPGGRAAAVQPLGSGAGVINLHHGSAWNFDMVNYQLVNAGATSDDTDDLLVMVFFEHRGSD